MARFCAEKWRSVGGFARYILKNRRRFSAQNVAVFCVAAATRQRSTHTRLLSRGVAEPETGRQFSAQKRRHVVAWASLA